MIRTAIAIVTPITIALLLGDIVLGLLPSIGALGTSMADRGGPYRMRALRISAAAPAAALGLFVGALVHGHGWTAVIVIVLMALLSAVISAFGNIGSVAGLQLLLFASLGSGLPLPFPPWLDPLLFLVGAAWTLGLSLLGWALFPGMPERRSVADAYRSLAHMMSAVGAEGFEQARQNLTSELNVAYDTVLNARATDPGPDSRRARLVALLNLINLACEATLTLALEERTPRRQVIQAVEKIADAVRHNGPPPTIPPPLHDSPGSRTMHAALEDVAGMLAGRRPKEDERLLTRTGRRERLREVIEELRGGYLVRLHALRLMACMGIAGVLTEVVSIERSYWVLLTIAIVLKPDFGSVFARAVQRGLGTVVGVALGGALITVVPYGPAILVPIAVFAALMPYGMQRNYGLFTTFNAPLVILLVDLLTKGGWDLVWARLLDTLLGCAIVLIVGYASWPSSWTARVGPQFAAAVEETARYLRRALSDQPAGRSQMRRTAYRSLSDLRTVFQRALSEPHAMRRRITAWWPAVIELERLTDLVTALATGVRHGDTPPPGEQVELLAATLDEIADAVRSGDPPRALTLPDDEPLDQITAAVRSVRSVFLGPEGDRSPAA